VFFAPRPPTFHIVPEVLAGKAENSTQHYVSPGVHYLVTDDLEVGVRLGWGLNDQSARFFANVGFGWRF
jgi:hypothetical protein